MQGQSRVTAAKEGYFESFFRQQFRIFENIHRRHPRANYFHFDCNAGCGENYRYGCEGSPLVFRNVAREVALPTVMYAAERDALSADALAQKLQVRVCDSIATLLASGSKRCVYCGDNRDLLQIAPRLIEKHHENPKYAVGSLLLDPNNASEFVHPLKQIAEFTKVCPRIDVVMNFPGTSSKRNRGAFGDDHAAVIDVDSLPDVFNRKFVHIGETLGAWQLTVVVARNREWHAQGFFRWNSDHGKEIRNKLKYTREEHEQINPDGRLFA